MSQPSYPGATASIDSSARKDDEVTEGSGSKKTHDSSKPPSQELSDQSDWKKQLRILEAQNKKRLDQARQEMAKLKQGDPEHFEQIYTQTGISKASSQSSDLPCQGPYDPTDWKTQLRILEEQNKFRLDQAKEEMAKLKQEDPERFKQIYPWWSEPLPQESVNDAAGDGN